MTHAQLELILSVCKRPGMFVVNGNLDCVIAYIDGLDQATGCLVGFREWLVTRFEDGNNLVWGGLVRKLLRENFVAEEDSIVRLCQLFIEFKQFLDACHTHREAQLKIYLRYHAWLLNRSYYQPDFPGYIPPYDGCSIPE